MVRVGIDAHMLGRRETGNETYIRELLRALAVQQGDRVVALVEAGRCGAGPAAARVAYRELSSSNALHRVALGLSRAARRIPLDLLHVTFNGPLTSEVPFVATIHDLSCLRHPRLYGLRLRLQFRLLTGTTIRRARALIVLSEDGRRELLRFFPGQRGKIRVIPLAAAPEFAPAPAAEIGRIRRAYGLDRPYILYVGTGAARKNLSFLVDLWRELRRSDGSLPVLVLAGPMGRGRGELRGGADAGEPIRLGYVPAADLPALYSGADFLVHPAIHEGFGLTLIEAMACGTPVLAFRTAALPETVGEGGLLADAGQQRSFADGLLRLHRDAALRRALAQRALDRARRWSWADAARSTWAVYEDASRRAS